MRTRKTEDHIKQYESVYDVVTKQIFLLDVFKVKFHFQSKVACAYYIIAVFYVKTVLNHNLSQKVVFLFRSFLVLTVRLALHNNLT